MLLERQVVTESPVRHQTRQLDLFEMPPASPALELLESIDPDAITPRQALDFLFQLKSLVSQ
jgi:DNA mismatch repair protein MutS